MLHAIQAAYIWQLSVKMSLQDAKVELLSLNGQHPGLFPNPPPLEASSSRFFDYIQNAVLTDGAMTCLKQLIDDRFHPPAIKCCEECTLSDIRSR